MPYGIDQDVYDRAVQDLTAFCSEENVGRREQQLQDLRNDLLIKITAIETMERARMDALTAATHMESENPALAFALRQRAGILLEEIEKARPHGQVRRIAELEQLLADMQSTARVLGRNNGR